MTAQSLANLFCAGWLANSALFRVDHPAWLRVFFAIVAVSAVTHAVHEYRNGGAA